MTQTTTAVSSRIAATLGAAFTQEPLARWTYGVSDDLQLRLTRAFTLWIEGFLALGDVGCTQDGAGAAVWLPPDDAVDIYTHDLRVREAIVELTLDGGRRHDQFWDWADSTFVVEHRWRLDLIGVRSPQRRRGIGAALIEHGLASPARRAQMPS